MQKNLIIICGPTATGKTALGIRLAKKFHGEIVSADSRQIYKGMDLGTGKDIGNVKAQMSNIKTDNKNFNFVFYELKGIKMWLLDIVEPNYRFNVADYLECAKPVINDIWQRGRLPILVGGTGFYIKALLEGIETVGLGPNLELRKKLEDYNLAKLQNLLKIACPERLQGMNQSDRNNPRRLMRAIEIAKSQMSNLKRQNQNLNLKIDKVLVIGLKTDNKILHQRIDKRVDGRIRQGMIQEVQRLLKQGISHRRMQEIGLEYRYIDDYLRGKLKKEEMIQKLKYAIHGYARRQLTWFKKQKKIHWFDIKDKGFLTEIENLIMRWYNL